MYLSFQFQMNKKELEMHFAEFFFGEGRGGRGANLNNDIISE